jgi:hypothetical protein
MSLRNRPSQRRPDHTAADSEALAAYLLNALEPEQQHAVHRHLQTCDICYLEYTSLAVLPGLLDTLTLDDISELAKPEPPEAARARDPRPAPANRPGRARSHRRRASLLAGGAFSAAMVATGFVPAHAASAVPMPVQPGDQARRSTETPPPDVVMAVSAVPLPEDETTTALDVQVRSERPLRSCVLQVTTVDGDAIEACRWQGAPSTHVVFSGDIPLAASEIRSIEVLGTDGVVLAARAVAWG